MGLRAERHRILAILWKHPDVAWRWATLNYGWAQPKRFALGPGPWRWRTFRFHLTPIHVERSPNWEIGICLGKRTLCVLIHR